MRSDFTRGIPIATVLSLAILSVFMPFARAGDAQGSNSPSTVQMKTGSDNLEFTSNGSSVYESINGGPKKEVWHRPSRRDRDNHVKCIRKIKNPRHSKGDALLIEMENGDTYVLPINPDGSTMPVLPYADNPYRSPTESSKEATGDAIYTVTSSYVYATGDSGNTWIVDSAGLGGGFGTPNWVDLDSALSVYLAYSTGLFKQDPDNYVWRKISSFPENVAISVFVDRKNRLFASSYSKIYLSSDTGSSFVLDTMGIGLKGVSMFGDDALGNVYAFSGPKMWRSLGGTNPWTRIDQSISSLDYEGNPYNQLFSDIAGDSVLTVATAFGIFSSTDHGSSWTESNQGISATAIYGFGKTSSGRKLESTDLGVFYVDPASSSWSKSFPPGGYETRLPIFQDNAGNFYSLLRRFNPATFTEVQTNWKSTDGGGSWAPDTGGFSVLGSTNQVIYGVDETGTQHMANTIPVVLFAKKPGQSWATDGAGFVDGTSDEAIMFGSDGNSANSIYVSTLDYLGGAPKLWKRPTSGGSWQLDTAGLSGAIVYALTGDRTGNPIAGTMNGVYRRTGGTWSRLPFPTVRGVSSTSNSFVVSVDSTGAILAGFSDLDLTTFNSVWHGVYFTTDNGVNWTYVGLDSISVKGLVSYGDTTYAYTYTNGTFALTHNGLVNSVAEAPLPVEPSLSINYPNPFNPSTTISYRLPSSSKVTLRIFDVLGREVTTLVSGVESSGVHERTWTGSGYASGVYFYRLEVVPLAGQGKPFVATRKMVMVK